MEIKQHEDGPKGKFFIEESEEVLAQMTYVWSGDDRIIIDHTEVSEKLKGKSAGKLLLAQAVAFAREKGIKILPLCPFAKAVFEKYPGIRTYYKTKTMDKNNLTKEYTNCEITVVWQSGKCAHSANCVRHLSRVFQPKEQPWIKLENANSAEIISAVGKCPSGALSIK
jgi:predicted GNAT family acetyltransferase/uncharacterized Fe-S cluster protein YjdI